ncbi:Flp family type IVb pilin [Zavarzinella formosa]|uniref:Flp family type IVb pilin n=1 Tax=Zavarzinella formosa TaxID=360055 RepID=UPI0002F3CDDE|nr:hypothetical protein [Zavarzinella formosa]
MSRFLARKIHSFLKQEDGVTAVECAFMLALVVLICFMALKPPVLPQSSNQVQIEVCDQNQR